MWPVLLSCLIPLTIALAAGGILFPLLLRWSDRAGLLDKPDHRKVHKKATPVIGGICIALALFLTSLCSAPVRDLLLQHESLGAGMLLLSITGLADDRRSLSPRLRLLIQLSCAAMAAHQGIRLQSLYGFAGITDIPVWLQYGITVFLITGLTNAFNLIDGIDGLSGGMALINCIVLGAAAVITGQHDWLYLLLPMAGLLTLFLRFNWHPARLFMGDSGTLFLGFFMSVLSILLIGKSYGGAMTASGIPPMVVVSLTACFMIPAMDVLRVFTERIRGGKSPFSPDRTHLHHKLVRTHLRHDTAAARLLLLHSVIIACSVAAIHWLPITVVVLLQMGAVAGYTLFLNFARRYIYWLRFIRRMEAAPPAYPENNLPEPR